MALELEARSSQIKNLDVAESLEPLNLKSWVSTPEARNSRTLNTEPEP